ncbi:MAG: hypothetical protein PHS14_20790 [Elusimicrobia bacterium]|nr:hypothetical protein [Elusimicrobiota bacterium]
MPVEVLTNAYILINAVPLHSRSPKVTLTYEKEEHQAPAFGDAGQRRVSGLYDWSAAIEFYRDEDAGMTIQTLWPLVGVQTAIAIRAKNTTIATTNAEYQGNGMCFSLPVVDADVKGGAATFTVTFKGSDGAALIRDVTP